MLKPKFDANFLNENFCKISDRKLDAKLPIENLCKNILGKTKYTVVPSSGDKIKLHMLQNLLSTLKNSTMRCEIVYIPNNGLTGYFIFKLSRPFLASNQTGRRLALCHCFD
jgi:hypothetical protein